MSYRISGHESFTCRYTWLPKVVHCLKRDDRLLTKEEEAMVELGVGKNMVRSIRFWAHSADITDSPTKDGVSRLTRFATTLLGEDGLDPFLEDVRTLWLLHWKLATRVNTPLLAWDYLLNRWQEPEIVPSAVVRALQREATNHNDNVSPTSVAQHFETFLHTYVPTRGRKGKIREDNLDCPLVELGLIVHVGERDLDRTAVKREAIYAFRREEKPEITPELFVYCLASFWHQRHPNEATLSFREVAHGHGSPGQVFKLPEEDVRIRVESIDRQTGGMFSYVESSSLQQMHRHDGWDEEDSLRSIYRADRHYD
jgi:Protein of unknown function (DUF4007)